MSRDRKPNKQFTPIGVVLRNALAGYRRGPDGELARIFDLWEDAVGGTIADNAQPAAFKGRVLVVHVNSSAWLHQLRFLKADIIEKVNAALGKPLVDEIRFRIGPFF
jgi:predicted nucleic acid-binding Zn ribbon protein